MGRDTVGRKKIFTKELWGMILALFSFVSFFCLCTGDLVFYPVGNLVAGFFKGLFGYFAYPLFVFLTVSGVMTVIGKKIAGGKALVTAISLSITFIASFLTLHLALYSPVGNSFGDYVVGCYEAGYGAVTVGGATFAVIIYGLNSLLSTVGSFIIYAILIVLGIVGAFREKLVFGRDKENKAESENQSENLSSTVQSVGEERQVYGDSIPKKKLIVVGSDKFETKEDSKYAGANDYGNYYGGTYSGAYNGAFAENSDYKKREEKLYSGSGIADTYSGGGSEKVSERIEPEVVDDGYLDDVAMPMNYKDKMGKLEETYIDEVDGIDSDAGDDTLVDTSTFEIEDEQKQTAEKSPFSRFERRTEAVVAEEPEISVGSRVKSTESAGNPYDEMPLNFKYNAPPLDLLRDYNATENYGEVEMFKKLKAEAILNALKHLSGIEAQIANIVHGPTVTRFDLAIPDNVSIKNVTKYADDIKLRLQCKNEIRFATVPGTSYLGLEVPNDKQAIVGLKTVISSREFNEAKPSSLTFAIGQDLIGNPVVADINKMPHLLIAGATGTGKSVGLNALLVSLMYKYSPQDLRFIIVDPKQVEFTIFSGIPHMLFDEIICETSKAIEMLNWAVKEMESRYSAFKEAQVRNIAEYNMQIDPRKERRMARIVILVDEFADLMSVDKKNIEDKIARLAQKARAAGIYLILATQRPSVNIIEGSIKTNFTSRMAFKMSNAIDSQTILNEMGAEKLLGNGDLLYKMSYMSSVERAQGAFIDTDEIKSVVKYIKDNNKSYFNETALAEINGELSPQIENVTADGDSSGKGGVTKEHLFALYLAVQLGDISISMLQRKMRFGFARAGAMCDWMERKGYIVDGGTGKRKKVTLTEEKFMELYGDQFSVEEYEDKYGLM